jgi:hypothetical protein
MTDEEIEKKARAEYEASADASAAQRAWEDLPEYLRIQWRELVRGNAGIAG